MGAYLESAEDIARKKLSMYSELLENISNFKKDFMSPSMLEDQIESVSVPKELIRIANPKKH